MHSTLFNLIPKEAAKIVLVLFLSFLVGLEREEHKVGSGPVWIRRRAHVSSDRIAGIRAVAGFPDGNLDSASGGICGARRVFVGVLPAQTGTRDSGGNDERNFGTADVCHRRAGVPGAILDRHDDYGDGSGAARVENLPRKFDEARAGQRTSDVYEVSDSDGGDSARCAEPIVWRVWIQSVQDMARGCGGERHFLRQLSSAELPRTGTATSC